MLRSSVVGWIAGIGLAMAAMPAVAHPHVWIEMRSAALLDDRGHVAAIRLEWLFDRFYSAFAEEDLDTDRDRAVSGPEAQRWAENALGNLKESGYFTEIIVDGRSYTPSLAVDPVGRWRDGQLSMAFVVRLPEPVDPRRMAVGYMAYDPSFYIDIRHVDARAAGVEGRSHANCSAEVRRSDPSPEVIASAAALDRDETAPPGLGRLFADHVRVTCR